MQRLPISPVAIFLSCLLVAATITGFATIPTETMLPVHWNFSGEPDNFLPRNIALAIAPLTALGLLLMPLLIKRAAGEATYEANRFVLPTVVSSSIGILLVLQAVIVRTGTGGEVDVVRTIVVAMAIVLIIVGNILPKSQPNVLSGMQWAAKNDPAALQQINRFAGACLMTSGVLVLLVAIITGHPSFLLGAVILAFLITGILTFWYSRRSGLKNS